MQNRQSGRRRRGGSNNPRPMGQPMGGQNNRLEVKVRGNANQLLEKYKVLARDAHQAGDRVAAEYYLQHSDHYFRVLNDSRIRQEELRARRNVFDSLDDDQGDDVSVAENESDGASGEEREEGQARAPRRTQRDNRQAAGDEERGRRWPPRSRTRPDDSAPADSAPADSADEAEAGNPGGAPAELLVEPEAQELTMSDGEAALVAFGGRPRRAPAARRTAPAETVEETPAADSAVSATDAEAEEAPKPRRRGRPRKVVDAVPAAED